MTTRRRAVLGGLVAAGLVAAVITGVWFAVGRDTGPGTALHLRATAEQWRTDEVNRTVAVALHNDGAVPVRVTRVELVLPSFAGEETVRPAALLPVGGLRVDVPVRFGTGTCVDGGPTTSAASHVVVDAAPDGGVSQRLRLALPEPSPLLDRLLATDCAAERIRSSVAIRFGPWREGAGGALRGALLVERAGGVAPAPVTVHDIGGSVVIKLTAERSDPVATLAAATARAEIPLAASAARCDPHAIAEVKKPFDFRVGVSVGTSPRLVSTVSVTEGDRRALDAMLRRQCRLPS